MEGAGGDISEHAPVSMHLSVCATPVRFVRFDKQHVSTLLQPLIELLFYREYAAYACTSSPTPPGVGTHVVISATGRTISSASRSPHMRFPWWLPLTLRSGSVRVTTMCGECEAAFVDIDVPHAYTQPLTRASSWTMNTIGGWFKCAR